MTPDHTDTPKEPQPITGCLGICCHLHQNCHLYYAVDGLTEGRLMDTCGIGLDKPKFLEVVK